VKEDLMNNRLKEWDKSYENKDNYLFSPHEEVVRFMSRFVRKRIGLNTFLDMSLLESDSKFLDLGCGIGRHVIYCYEMGLEAYGIDLSETAISVARDWGSKQGIPLVEKILVQGDICALPFSDQFFRYAISHAVLDSMPFEMARVAVAELARVMQPGGIFYCDLIAGDDSGHSMEFAGEEIIETLHENSTIQSYFDVNKIEYLFKDQFKIQDLHIVRRENLLSGSYTSRYHVVVERK
jgi:ubiquinone/menaquinone biosynthesis C-methylase UbiE